MFYRFMPFLGFLLIGFSGSGQELPYSYEASSEQLAVYVIPITDAIGKPNVRGDVRDIQHSKCVRVGPWML